MTREQLNKGNNIALNIKTSEERLNAFKDLYNSEKCEDREHFNIHYMSGNIHCVIQETDDIYDILNALIKYESDKIERLKKELEEL